MPILRSLRLIGAVEAGTVNGAQLQVFLTDAGRNAEFSVLLANRGQARRMANNPVTMEAIVLSQKAIDTVFKSATKEANAAAAAVVVSSAAMTTTSSSLPSLDAAVSNPVTWGLFSKSAHYESNVISVVARLALVNPALYPTMASLVADPLAIADVSAFPKAMKAVVASAPTVTLVAASAVAMALVAADTVAIDTVAKETAIMPIIAASAPAMVEIVSRPIAMTKMATYPGSITAISKVPAAWASYLASGFFAANLPLALANMIGVSPSAFPTLDSIIADPVALGKVAANKSAVQALASNSAAMTTLANSPNIGVILGSTVAMAVIGPNATAMGSFLGASGAWAGLFASSIAKSFIVASTALVDIVAGNGALITYLKTIAVNNVLAPGIPDGNATAMQPFVGAPAKLLMLSAKEAGIAATFSNYNFGGSAMTGANAGATLTLSAAAQVPHVAGYTGLTWNLQAIGVTAATLPIITYVDMS